jgi:type IV secretion system protein VirB3
MERGAMELIRHPVHRALTRPQLFGGVTYSFFVIEMALVTELFLVTKSFWALPAALLGQGSG